MAGFNFVWKTGLVFMHERVYAERSFWNIKKKKICFAQHCVLIADKGNHHLLQTVAPSNQGQAGCLSPGCSCRDTYMLLPEVVFTTDIITFKVLSLHYLAPAAIVTTRVGLKHRLRNMA